MEIINTNRLRHLDVYKGVAILFVIVTHYAWTAEERLQYFFPYWIDMAVPAFMIITGYLTAMSFEKNPAMWSIYSPRTVIAKWMRFIVPYLLVFAISLLEKSIVHHDHYSGIRLIKYFIIGTEGPGSYYFPVMIQVVLIVPLIWIAVRNLNEKGLMVCFSANVLFEMIKTAINLSAELYRLCAFRYIYVLAFGCFLYYNEGKITDKKPYWLAGMCGIVYISVFNYTSLVPIITNQWKTTSVFAVLLIVPIMSGLLRENHIHNRLLEQLGHASFNIFLVQMVYYRSIVSMVYERIESVPLRLTVNVLVNCIVGVLFYKVEQPITKKLIRAIKK